MKLEQLIKIADKVYPDSMVEQAFRAKGRKVGDGLAEFIAEELKETYDPKATSLEQLNEAIRVMESAHKELETVVNALIQRNWSNRPRERNRLAKATTFSASPRFNQRGYFLMEKKHAIHLLQQLIIKHGQVRHNEALETLREATKGYTVIGLYGDNQQPWMAHVEKASSPKDAAKKGIKITYNNGENGVELEDIFVVDVVEGYAYGTLCNDRVVSLKDLQKRK